MNNIIMKISVIAIFYKSAGYVRKCVDSILNQKGSFDLELIAVDDCSPDDTLAILNSYADERIKILHHEKNAGISAARNTGLKNVTGDAFYFIDGDDFLPEGALEALAAVFSDDVDWVQGAYAICDETDELMQVKANPAGRYETHAEIVKNFDKLEFIYTHNRLVNKRWASLLFPLGKAHEDRFWNVRAFPDIKRIINISEVTYNYIAHPSSFSNKSRASRLYLDSAVELMTEMDALDHCWKGTSDTFLITAIEKNLYLWKQDSSYKKSVLKKIKKRSLEVSIDVGSFPRFTKMIHTMIVKGYPDLIIDVFASLYRGYIGLTHKMV